MKTVDKMEVLHSQSAEFIKQAEPGKFHKLIPDTFIIKGDKKELGYNQGYAIRHINRQDMILIDVVEESTKNAVKNLVEKGYKIKGIFLTCDGVMKSAYADLKTISEDAGGAPVYAHPLNSIKDNYKTKDITANKDAVKSFGLRIFDLPGDGGASVLIFSEINDGMLFPGDDAVGSDYDSDLNTFDRPKWKKDNDNYGLAESWGAFNEEFTHFFPRKGKPKFNLDEGTRTDILTRLSRT